MRRTPLRQRGTRGSAFPHRRNPDYWHWLGLELLARRRCDACGVQYAQDRAHLVPRSRAGNDRENIALLCRRCHRLSEKRVERFIQESGVDLYAQARAHTARYEAERGLPF